MKKQSDWNPLLYLKYGNERTQAAVDLISRIRLERPARIIDLGCGPGNSTQALVARWPGSRITGLDSSPAMIAKARADYPALEWITADAAAFESDENFDLVFSSATIQWIPDHARLLKRFLGLVSENGALAVQMPLFNQMPMYSAITRTAGQERWRAAMDGVDRLFTYETPEFYYDLLAPACRSLDLWVTAYCHMLDSRPAIIEWMKATGLRPYLDRLPEESDKRAFETDLLAEVEAVYPLRPNSRVLFPFKRLFFIAYV